MKIKLLSIISLFLIINTYAQQYELVFPETWGVDIWNGSGWTHFSNTIYEFNSDCLPTTTTTQVLNFDTGEFDNSVLQIITYTNGNQSVIGINYIWNGVDWDEHQKFEHTYFIDNLISTVNYDWDTNTDSWKLIDQILNEYDVLNRTTISTTQVWDHINEEWNNFEKREYTYENNSIYIETETTYTFNESGWNNFHLFTNTYHTGTNLVQTEEHEDWLDGSWQHDFKIEYTYDVNEHLIEKLWSDWSTDTMNYVFDNRETYVNNIRGNPTLVNSEVYVLSSWVNASRQNFTYPNCLTLFTKEKFEINDFKIYPNPFENYLSVNLPDYIQILKIEIYNNLGQSVYSSSENRTNLDLTNLPSGLYILNLKTDTGNASFKILKN